jgi:hypothetical protein
MRSSSRTVFLEHAGVEVQKPSGVERQGCDVQP